MVGRTSTGAATAEVRDLRCGVWRSAHQPLPKETKVAHEHGIIQHRPAPKPLTLKPKP